LTSKVWRQQLIADVAALSSGTSQSFWLTEKANLLPDMRRTSSRMYVPYLIDLMLRFVSVGLICDVAGVILIVCHYIAYIVLMCR